MKNVFEILRQKEIEFEEAQKEFQRANQKMVGLSQEVTALRLAAKLLADDTDGPINGKLKRGKLTQAQMAYMVLQEAKREMHVKEIAEAIAKKYPSAKIKPEYLAPVLFRERNRLFHKSETRPNTFGLFEWTREPKAPQIPQAQPNQPV